MELRQCFSNGNNFVSRRYLASLETFLVVITWGMLLASAEQRPGILLNILQCKGQPNSLPPLLAPPKNYLVKISVVLT